MARAESSRFRNEAERGAARDQRSEIGAVEARGQDHRGRRVEAASRSATSKPSKSGSCTSTIARSGRCSFAARTALGAVSGLGHDDEAAPLEQLSRRCAEGAVVVDDEHAPAHGRIVPADGRARQCG